MHKRTDRLSSLRVDLAINIAAARGVQVGAGYLCDIGIPLDVALRVLLNPAARRGAAQPDRAAEPAVRPLPASVALVPPG